MPSRHGHLKTLDVARKMETVHSEDPQKWSREMKPTFDNAQEPQAALHRYRNGFAATYCDKDLRDLK
jgi:hypothetical protein